MVKNIILAGGCFWGLQKYISLVNGVVCTEVGYANGIGDSVNYKDVCNGSGHAEVVLVMYDYKIIALDNILELYFDVIDPLSINKQGGDIGVQYRTGVYFVDDLDEEYIKTFIEKMQKKYENKIMVEVLKLKNYIKAEDYHQNYLDNNANGYCHIKEEKFECAKKYKCDICSD